MKNLKMIVKKALASVMTVSLAAGLAVGFAGCGSAGKTAQGSNESRPPDAGIIKRYFRVPALQAVAGFDVYVKNEKAGIPMTGRKPKPTVVKKLEGSAGVYYFRRLYF